MRSKQSTNEFYRSVLDNAVREQWAIQKPDVHRAKQEQSRRLSSLYGYNMSSTVIRKRLNKKGKGRPGSRQSVVGPGGSTPTLQRSSTFMQQRTSKAMPRGSVAQTSSRSLSGGIQAFQPSIGLLEEGSELNTLKEDDEEEEDLEDFGYPSRDASRSRTGLSDTRGLGQTRSSISIGVRPEKSEPSQAQNDNNEEVPDDAAEGRAEDSTTLRKKKRRPRPLIGSTWAASGQDFNLSEIERTRIKIKQPWYVGHQNSVSMPSHVTTTNRYGYKGTLNMMRMEKGLDSKSIDYGITSLTLKHSLPRFKDDEKIVDEYVEQISGPPRSWPKKTDYVMGSALKETEPTPEFPERTKRYFKRMEEQLAEFNEQIILERQLNKTNTLPWRGSVVEICHSTGRPVQEKNRLIQEGKRVRYWPGATALCVQDDDEKALKAALDKELMHQLRMRELRWSESLYFYKLLRSASIQLRPDLGEFTGLLLELRREASGRQVTSLRNEDSDNSFNVIEEGDEEDDDEESKKGSSVGDSESQAASEKKRMAAKDPENAFISRDEFINVVLRRFEHADKRRLNKIYSGFDPHRVDRVDYRYLMALQRFLWKHEEDIADKALVLFDIFEQHMSNGVLSAAELKDLFSLCAIEKDEQDRIFALVKETKPFLASHTLYSSPGFISREEFQHMLAALGPSENHPLLIEFKAQYDRRWEELFKVGKSEQRKNQTKKKNEPFSPQSPSGEAQEPARKHKRGSLVEARGSISRRSTLSSIIYFN